MSKNKTITKEIKEIIKKMYETGISSSLIVSMIRDRYNVEVSANSIRQWASVNKWQRKQTDASAIQETLQSLPQKVKNELNQVQKLIESEEPDSEEILKKMSNLFNSAYEELSKRLSDKDIAMTLEIDDLIKVIKTSSEALVELKKINKRAGDVYIQFNVDISTDYNLQKEKRIDKVIEIVKESEKIDVENAVESVNEEEAEDIFDRLMSAKKSSTETRKI